MDYNPETRTQSRHRVNWRAPSEQPLEETKFEWYVFEDGFEWKRCTVKDGPTLSFLCPKNGGRAQTAYDPLAHTELFDQFSRLYSPESIMTFADKYGWLGLHGNYGPEYDGCYGEARVEWTHQISEMRIVLELWDLIQAEDVRALKEFIHWRERHVEFCCRLLEGGGIRGCPKVPKTGFRFDIIAQDGFGRHFPTWKRGEVLRPATLFVATTVNGALRRQISSTAVFDKDGALRPYYSPTCLLAALWLQVYQQITGQTKFRRCGICGSRMDVTNNRSHKRVHDRCSHRMRMQRYRS
jgi:hypothetical protein